MTSIVLVSQRLELRLQSPDELQQMIAQLPPEQLAEVSPEWRARVAEATTPDPFIHGFKIVSRDEGNIAGTCAFKSPPTDDGIVEIAYGIEPGQQGQGFATEAVEALCEFAAEQNLSQVIAHTLPESNASTSVLKKCHFQCLGEVSDPDDGPVWRWTRHLKPLQPAASGSDS